MDNCSCHRSARVEALCAKRGVTVEYLPLYCPFFNPIKESFKDLKAYIRQHYRQHAVDYENFESFLQQIIKEVRQGPIAKKRVRGHFRHLRYNNLKEREVG